MIDDVVLKCKIDPPEQVLNGVGLPFNYMGLSFDPVYRQGVVIKYLLKFRGLRFVIKDDIFLISGSWHKFYHGENHGDYTWEQIGETINVLYEWFGEVFLDAEITKLTIGCNTSLISDQIVPRIIGIRGKKPSDMLGGTNHRSYGKYYKMTHYRYKVYDKQSEVKWHDKKRIPQILRLEKEIIMRGARSRAKNPIKIYKPFDLLNPDFLTICQVEMHDFIEKLEFSNEQSLGVFEKASDLQIYQVMNDLDVRLAYKKLADPKTYRSKLKRFQELRQNFSNTDPDLSDLLSKKVEEKISELGARSPLLKIG